MKVKSENQLEKGTWMLTLAYTITLSKEKVIPMFI